MGPCIVNVRQPTVDSRCRGTTIICCVAELRRCLPTTSVTSVQQSTRYYAFPVCLRPTWSSPESQNLPVQCLLWYVLVAHPYHITITKPDLLSTLTSLSSVDQFLSGLLHLFPCLSKRYLKCFFAVCNEQRH